MKHDEPCLCGALDCPRCYIQPERPAKCPKPEQDNGNDIENSRAFQAALDKLNNTAPPAERLSHQTWQEIQRSQGRWW